MMAAEDPRTVSQSTESESVELEIPPGGELLSLARLTAATLAARSDFSVEEVEDLRLAVDELCLPLVRASNESRLRLRFTRDDDSVAITCMWATAGSGSDTDASSAVGGEGGVVPLQSEHPDDALSTYILDALVDEHGPVDENHRLAGHWLRKRRAS
jgi:anti-sigma regulatory factor (Ser/Thr protein kinase)